MKAKSMRSIRHQWFFILPARVSSFYPSNIMKCSQFMTVPYELKIQIIRKVGFHSWFELFQCNPVPYVRLRQSCRTVDDFCEKNRKRLGIYSQRKNPSLKFTKYLFRDPKSGSQSMNLTEDHLFVNHGIFDPKIKYMKAMTQKNVPDIQKSLSGFAFTHVSIGRMSDSIEKLNYFLEIAGELKINRLTLDEPPGEYTALLLSKWNIEHLCLEFYYNYDDADYYFMDCVKRIPSISYWMIATVQTQLDPKTIVQNALGRKSFKFQTVVLTDAYNLAYFLDVINGIYENWQRIADTPDTLSFWFTYGEQYRNLDLVEEFHEFLPQGTVTTETIVTHRRNFTVFEGKEMWRERRPNRMQHNLWIIKVNQELWRILTVRRGRYDTDLKLWVQTARNQDQLLGILMEFVGRLITDPTDLSTIYEKLLQSKNSGELAQHFNKFKGYFLSHL